MHEFSRLYRSKLPDYVHRLRDIKELVITNIILLGQTPAVRAFTKGDSLDSPEESLRAKVFLERLAASGADETSTDSFGNPIALLKGKNPEKKPIILAVHLDSVISGPEEVNYRITETDISGRGVADNAAGAGAVLSIPEILRCVGLELESDLYLLGLPDSLGKKNLKSIREFFLSWERPVRGAVCLEGMNLGRLSYYSRGMIRAEIHCRTDETKNSILVINEIVNRMLAVRLPLRPASKIVIGKIGGGIKHGDPALSAALGFEIVSDSRRMVDGVFKKVLDMTESLAYEKQVRLRIEKVSDIDSVRLDYSHPLVKSAIGVMESLSLTPEVGSSESELSLFLSQGIPAVAVGISDIEHQHTENASVAIDPLFKGIAQVLGILIAIDQGACDA